MYKQFPDDIFCKGDGAVKTLGAKVPDEIYQSFAELDKSISESLREAIALYLRYKNKQASEQKNSTNIAVNQRKLPRHNENQKKLSTDHRKNKQDSSKTQSLASEINKHRIKKQKQKMLRSNPVNQQVNVKHSYLQHKSGINKSLLSKKSNRLSQYIEDRSSKAADTSNFFQCPYCKKDIVIQNRSFRNRQINCPHCGRRLLL